MVLLEKILGHLVPKKSGAAEAVNYIHFSDMPLLYITSRTDVTRCIIYHYLFLVVLTSFLFGDDFIYGSLLALRILWVLTNV